ncbi:unnamed protein product [Phytomonas sp. EM1]|nr:unnamed protein product [Phytomonas sp. EM1]|eukprot:CCW59905.1 unnamed protein product [Phytomonas sp. isolate EM1]
MEALKAKGNEFFKAAKYKEAIEWYTKAIATNPNAEAAGSLYSNRAACWQCLGEYDKAMEDSEQCIKMRPDWLKGYFRKGLALQSMNRLDEAQKTFQEALKVEPHNQEVMDKLQAINDLLRKRNQTTKPASCKTLEDAKKLGNSLFSEGKYDLAAQFYTRAIELEPRATKDKAVCYANRAACYQQTHLYSMMAEDCSAAIAIDSQNVKAYIRRAIAYEGMEKWKLALDDYNTAKQLAPSLASVSQGLLRCQRALRGGM